MASALQPYQETEESVVHWLGAVPTHWEQVCLGRLGRFSKGSGGTKEDEAADGVPCIRYGDIYSKYGAFITRAESFVAHERATHYTPVEFGDVLFAGSGETLDEIGKSAVNLIEGDVVCGGDLLILRPDHKLLPRFLGYAANSSSSVHQKACMGRGITVMHIYADELKYLRIPLPPVAEQDAIVRFLDHAERRIRRAIRAKQQLIALLSEQKRVMIDHVVTRGLDPNVPLKPSGVDWLGDVPQDWDVRPAKRFFREIDERSETGAEELLSVSHLTGVTPRREKNVSMFMASSYVGHKTCKPGDVVVNTMWAWMGALGVAKQVGIVSSSYAVYRPLHNSALLSGYAELLLKSTPYISEYMRRSTGIRGSRLRLYPERFLTMRILCPPQREQRAILHEAAQATDGIARSISAAQSSLDLLREYRTRLIDDVVTGKLDVREAAADLPDEIDEPEPLDEMSGEETDEDDVESLDAVEV
jgi:type I restriction enzyme S subunit